MIRLFLADPETHEVTEVDYDQHTSSFFDGDGTPLWTNTAASGLEVEEFVGRVSPENPGKKVQRVRVLKIQLGLGCNYSCSYCLQGQEVHKAAASSTADTNVFLSNLDRWLDPSDLKKIEFWGGEPLLYWHKIEVLAPALRAKFPDVRLSMVTNGSLLTDEIIDKLDYWGFSIAISHDGPGQSVRGPDPLDDVETFARWHSVFQRFGKDRSSVNAVLSPKSYDVSAIIDWFQERFGDVTVAFEGVVHDYNGDEHSRFTDEQLYDLTMRLSLQMLDESALRSPSIFRKLQLLLRSFELGRPSSSFGQKCGMDKEDSLAVDLLGNVTTCQNTGALGEHRLGTVFLFDKIRLHTSRDWSFRKECSSCPVLQACQGGCMYQEGAQWVNSCNSEFAFNMAFFLTAVRVYTGKFVIGMDMSNVVRPKLEPAA